ncbi:kinesin-like protein KIF20B isoform X2 [Contarinia nasturtii]|nr:kinesin-like protein KIF20B isoform X2 [Contarinia nasturtii]XP_031619116.1 kinesin-like protein KIF20B isoform X2 [Contarinia nasturtii]XP_031619117.1 kinesin-like protein KIF20B isoform X2 [Contarinia nasturtii]XP_031619118.1 kinesin-like protein KIF20B isoform X2 [Contarinia nasturtii]XP_031619119.1 kinesin-like protein KIF20B isoform X2 [Contarinia nasturtii]XP_031619121.1 kinesin-like protein KIF20B isoform X2 [Contarinia nasturtii]XP_031619122.1 kinesin-like protein KIF20B isoform X2
MNGNGIKMSGRSSSQRSINDYPEHLNPFYEDENHKRLRFWKLGSDKPNRSNSFSIDGLKGLWSFKTFKLKKKSSSLGINKTSESPPMLRHDDRYGSQTTYDGRMRHTVDIGLSNNFERGAPCRSSLQDLNSISRNQSENFFIRNNRYRSTIQAGNSGISQQNRAQSNTTIGSATPVLRSRYNPTLSRGSSQLSVNSTNPFDDEFETISQIESPQRSSIRHSARKKRRAPQPPVSPNKPNIATVDETKVECETDNDLNETVNITNLTAEIESFVRTADTDKETIKSKEAESSALKIEETYVDIKENGNEKLKISRQSPESNDYYPHDDHCEEIPMEKIQNLGTTDVNSNKRCKQSPVKILIRAPTDEETTLVIDEEPTLEEEHKIEYKQSENDNYDTKDTEQEIIIVKHDVREFTHNNPKEALHQEEKVLHESKTPHEEEKVSQEGEKEMSHEEPEINDAEKMETKEPSESIKIVEDTEGTTTPTSSAVEFILENENMTDSSEVTVLKITESNEDLSKLEPAQNDTENQTIIKDPVVTESNRSTFRFEVRSVPLKFDSPKTRKKDIGTDGGKKREPPTPPQRRRSVKEIIESINKCQSLLKVNHDLKTDKSEKDKINTDLCQASSSSSMKTFKSKSSFSDRNMNDSIEKQYENKKMFSDITEVNNNAKTDDMSNIPLFVEKFNEFNNNNPNSIFEKCKVRDKTSNDEKVSNVEWNPVPKPRRHRNSTQGSIN